MFSNKKHSDERVRASAWGNLVENLFPEEFMIEPEGIVFAVTDGNDAFVAPCKGVIAHSALDATDHLLHDAFFDNDRVSFDASTTRYIFFRGVWEKLN